MKEYQAYMWSVVDWRTDELYISLNNQEKGIFRELIDECWMNDGFDPSPESLVAIAREHIDVISSTWQKVQSKFVPYKDGKVFSKRLLKDRLRLDEIRRKRAVSGALGGITKAQKALASAINAPPQKESKKLAKSSQTQTQTQKEESSPTPSFSAPVANARNQSERAAANGQKRRWTDRPQIPSNLQDHWKEILFDLKLSLSTHLFNCFVSPILLVDTSPYRFWVPNDGFAQWWKEPQNERLLRLILSLDDGATIEFGPCVPVGQNSVVQN